MNRCIRRAVTVAPFAALFLAFSMPLAAQQFERYPGPIPPIEDPIGEYKGETRVVPARDVNLLGEAQSTFIVTYNGFSPEAQVAFQTAVDIWAAQIQSSVPIRVNANWTALSPGVLGSARPENFYRFSSGPITNKWLPSALADKLIGMDLDPSDSDIQANINSGHNWYLGTDGNAGSRVDLVTVVLHELGHGLGMIGSMGFDTGTGSWGSGSGFPFIYDTFALNGVSQSLVNTTLFTNPSFALGNQLTGNNLFFGGANAISGNFGTRPKLYAPATWNAGSSFSHVDESTYGNGNPNSLMTPLLSAGEVIHDLGPIFRGILLDMGWTLSQISSTKGDFDGDRRADLTVYRPSNNVWYVLRTAHQTPAVLPAGQSGDIPLAADFDGDGITDAALYRPENSAWYALRSNSNFSSFSSFQWGEKGDAPVIGDFDGDGKADPAVYRASTGVWYILHSANSYATYSSYAWGEPGDMPVPDDYDGDGKTDIAVYRPSNGFWYILQSNSNFRNFASIQWGSQGDITVPADYDGDRKADIAIFRPSTNVWYILRSSSNFSSFTSHLWGEPADVPVPADFDGDGKTDIAVYRPLNNFWYILRSISNFTTYSGTQWGSSGDIPIFKRP